MTDMNSKHQYQRLHIRNKLKKLVRSDIHCYEILGEETEELNSKHENNTVNIYTNPIEIDIQRPGDGNVST